MHQDGTSLAHEFAHCELIGLVLSVAVWPAAPAGGKVRHVELKVSCQYQGDHTVMSVAGEIDLYTAPRLHAELAAAVAAGSPARIIVDMSGVEFCDSTGMNVLLAAQRLAREGGGDLELAGPRPAIRKILQVTGLESVFTVLDDPAAVVGQ
jgi:anti-sigma B factor antagonist